MHASKVAGLLAAAAFAGLRQGDVILDIDGEPIRSRVEALLLVARMSPGELVEVEVWREGSRITTTLAVAERPKLATTN